MAAFNREHRLWFHVDSAYGAFAAALESVPPDLKGLRMANLDGPNNFLHSLAVKTQIGNQLFRHRLTGSTPL
jgi:hypothetical protein